MSDSHDRLMAGKFDDDRHLMCHAHGCPNRWSVDAGAGQLCSAHAWAEREEWPRITERQMCIVADAALRRAMPKPSVPRLSREEKAALLQRLRHAITAVPLDAREWIAELREREEAGEVLTLHQRQCWRDAARRIGAADAVADTPASAPVALSAPPFAPAALDPEAEYGAAGGEPMPWDDWPADSLPPAMHADRPDAANRSARA